MGMTASSKSLFLSYPPLLRSQAFRVPGSEFLPSTRIPRPASAEEILLMRHPTLHTVVVSITSSPQRGSHCLYSGDTAPGNVPCCTLQTFGLCRAMGRAVADAISESAAKSTAAGTRIWNERSLVTDEKARCKSPRRNRRNVGERLAGERYTRRNTLLEACAVAVAMMNQSGNPGISTRGFTFFLRNSDSNFEVRRSLFTQNSQLLGGRISLSFQHL